jgi:hypothetical protein
MTATAYHLSSDLLESFGIESVVADITVERMSGESYHIASDVEEIVEVIGLDGCRFPREKLDELAISEGYDNVYLFIFEHFEDELQECAIDNGPEIESAQYSDYMARKAESDWH